MITIKADGTRARNSSVVITMPIITLSTHGWKYAKELKDEQEQIVAAAFAAVSILEMQNKRLRINQRGTSKGVPLIGSMHLAHAKKALEYHHAAVLAEM
eukprot:6176572-Pleurochrysis_carterae.AAC.1